MALCSKCRQPLDAQQVPSATQRKNRRRAGVPLDWLYCFYGRYYCPPTDFTQDPRPQPYVCDACIQRMIDATQRETQTTS